MSYTTETRNLPHIPVAKIRVGNYHGEDGTYGERYSVEAVGGIKASLWIPQEIINPGPEDVTVIKQQILVIESGEANITPPVTEALLKRCDVFPGEGFYVNMDQYQPEIHCNNPDEATFICIREPNHIPGIFQWRIEEPRIYAHRMGEPFN